MHHPTPLVTRALLLPVDGCGTTFHLTYDRILTGNSSNGVLMATENISVWD